MGKTPSIAYVKFCLHRDHWLSLGLCPKCREHRPVEPGKPACEQCIETRRRQFRERYAKRKADGVCARCGAPIEPGVTGTRCRACSEWSRVYMRNRKRGASGKNESEE